MSLLHEFWENFRHNLFKPLLLFFYMGFSIPLLKISFEFPYVIYQGLTMYLLISIGWHGGEELAALSAGSLQQAVGFMLLGFCTNFVIGVLAYTILRWMTDLRKVDAATIAGYYGSDSAGTFVTCVGVLNAAGLVYAAYMPVMLAVMEVPGCLVALYLVSRLRRKGLDVHGNSWDEPGYDPDAVLEEAPAAASHAHGHESAGRPRAAARQMAAVAHGGNGGNGNYGNSAVALAEAPDATAGNGNGHSNGDNGHHPHQGPPHTHRDLEREAEMSLERIEGKPFDHEHGKASGSIFSPELLHEVFLNPGLFLLFGGIIIGFISRLQGEKVTAADDPLFVTLFQGVLCLFLLEMGITASKRLKDLRQAGWKFIAFAIVAPNIFATTGIVVAHIYSTMIGVKLDIGTYVLFAVLCGAASYIAVPAVQRLAIPEASPTLPLAASLGCTFSYNVTIGIPLYILIAKLVMTSFPVGAA